MFKTPSDFSKLFASFPSVDLKGLMDAQQRNLAAFVTASNVVAEGAQAIFKRQAELVSGTIQESMDVARESLNGKGMDFSLQKQMDLAKISAEKNMAGAREIAEMASKSGNEAIEVLRKRATESFGEISQIFNAAA